MKNTFKKVLKVLLVITGLLLIAAAFIFAPIDHEPYKGSLHYTKMQALLDSLHPAAPTTGTFHAGWSKVSIVPSKPMQLASYGFRDKYEHVHDSIWCRSILLQQKNEIKALVTLDLLIFPPEVLQKLRPKLNEIGITEENLYLSASHTHNAPGGWAAGLGGRILAGPYDTTYVNQLTNAVLQSIQKAKKDLKPASLGFGKVKAPKVIFNRLSDTVDYWVRMVRIERSDKSNAALVSYSGHPNILSSTINHVSGDYAGALVDTLESSGDVQFAAFFAGAVATHSCRYYTRKDYKLVNTVSGYLYSAIHPAFKSITLQDSIPFQSIKIPVYLREPQLKINQNWKIRPWLFEKAFGKQDVFVNTLKLGNIVLVGTPCDFSGELALKLATTASAQHMDLMVTSFNGGYAGYILPDEYYDLDVREPRDMDWYGPNSGSYFTEIIEKLLKKF